MGTPLTALTTLLVLVPTALVISFVDEVIPSLTTIGG